MAALLFGILVLIVMVAIPVAFIASIAERNPGCTGCVLILVAVALIAAIAYFFGAPDAIHAWWTERKNEEAKEAAMQEQRLHEKREHRAQALRMEQERREREAHERKAIAEAREIIFADKNAKNEADAYAIKIDSQCGLYSIREAVLSELYGEISDAEKLQSDINDPVLRSRYRKISFRINRLSSLSLVLTNDIRRAYLSDCTGTPENKILRKYSRIAALARSEFDEIRQDRTTPDSEGLEPAAQLNAEKSGCDIKDLFDDDALANRFRKIAKTGSAKEIFECVRRIRRQKILADLAKWAAENGCPVTAQELAIWSITDKSLLQKLEEWDDADEVFRRSVRERIESL